MKVGEHKFPIIEYSDLLPQIVVNTEWRHNAVWLYNYWIV